jgi:hypothetical protein
VGFPLGPTGGGVGLTLGAGGLSLEGCGVAHCLGVEFDLGRSSLGLLHLTSRGGIGLEPSAFGSGLRRAGLGVGLNTQPPSLGLGRLDLLGDQLTLTQRGVDVGHRLPALQHLPFHVGLGQLASRVGLGGNRAFAVSFSFAVVVAKWSRRYG